MAIGRLRLKKVLYDFPPYRPPSEAGSLLLRVTRGCPWNQCRFCSMYRDITFQRRSVGEIKKDIYSAAKLYSDVVRTIFLADSNSLVVKTDDLRFILGQLQECFPNIERITSYARAKTILKKTSKDLEQFVKTGLTRLHVGLETGSASILKQVRKGVTPEEFIVAGLKAKEAGFELSVYVLLGIAGQDEWMESALQTASVLNSVNPHFIRVRTLQPQPGSDIYDDMQAGVFRKSSPVEVLREQKLMLENLEVTSSYLSDHITNYLPVNGRLPEDKASMSGFLDDNVRLYNQDDCLKEKFARKDKLSRL